VIRRGLLAIALVLAAAAPVHALTGAEWRTQPEPAKRGYVEGVVDAWHGLVTVQESLGGRDRGIAVFAEVVHCMRDRLMLPPQIFVIVERHVEDHPGLRSKDMADIIFAALSLACRR
jgi:hypothetical protein